jgi:hypothetical protein
MYLIYWTLRQQDFEHVRNNLSEYFRFLTSCGEIPGERKNSMSDEAELFAVLSDAIRRSLCGNNSAPQQPVFATALRDALDMIKQSS